MKQVILKELKSNFLRLFKNEYNYENIIHESKKEKVPFVVFLILTNLLLISLSISVDVCVFSLHISYLYSTLIRLFLVIFGVLNFQIWKDKYLTLFDILIFLLSLYIPIWSIFLVFYIFSRYYIKQKLIK